MRTLKDMLAAHVNANHTNWTEHLGAVTHVFNTCINISTGYTPFYLMYGRECHTPDTEFLHTAEFKDLDIYSSELRDALSLAWDTLSGSIWSQKTERYNQRPRKPLPFHAYELNELVYLKRIPRRFYTNQLEEITYGLSSKLQSRYCGPYRITKLRSPVLFEAEVHGKTRVVHAINMKPARVHLHLAADVADLDDENWDSDEEDNQNEDLDDIEDNDDTEVEGPELEQAPIIRYCLVTNNSHDNRFPVYVRTELPSLPLTRHKNKEEEQEAMKD